MHQEQKKQKGWHEQWSRYKDDSVFLFTEWIHPVKLEEFKGLRVLDAGCGHGAHLCMVAPHAREVVGVDLNCADIARREAAGHANVSVLEGDLAAVSFDEPFDAVYCIGVIHHTDDPDRTFENLKRALRPGGRMIVWAYSHEGNFWNRTLIEGLKRRGLLRLPAAALHALAFVLTVMLYPPVYSLYLLPLGAVLPYYDYFDNFRKLNFRKNVQNAFDKLIAPQTEFLKRERVESWFDESCFSDVHISHYKGVSWRCSGVKR